MAFQSYKKDPDSILDYIADFAATTNGRTNDGVVVADWLASGETISSATVTATNITGTDSSLTVDSSSIIDTNTAVKFWLSAGTLGQIYDVVVHVTTNAGREEDRTIRIVISQK